MKKFNDDTLSIIQSSIHNILKALGDDPSRDGLKKTPERVAKAYAEIFAGMQYTNDDIANMFGTCFEEVDTSDLVVVRDIPVFSMCEHHMLPMYNAKVAIGYIPNGKVIGLSKILRIADMCSRRLQLQERIGKDIQEVLIKVLDTQDVAVVISGEHACMTMRGIKKEGSLTKTASLSGLFKTENSLRQEFYNLIEEKR